MIPRPGAGPDPPGPGARTSLAAAPAAYRLLGPRAPTPSHHILYPRESELRCVAK